MQKIKDFINNADISRFRFWLQLFFFIIFIYGGYFSINLGNSIPIFSCGYDREVGGMCYFLPLQHQLARPLDVLFSVASISVLIGFITFLVWFIVFNKAWCGYACPLGTMQDWLTSLRKRMGIRYSTYTQPQFQKLKKIKYLMLALVILAPMGVGMGLLGGEWRTAFCEICPGRMITPLFVGDTSQWSLNFSTKSAMILTSLGLIITGLFFVGSFIKKRFFCFFCPMSAMHYIFSDAALIKLKKDGDKCTKCGDCYNVCDMQIKDIADDITSKNILRDDCILCMKCVAACPEDDALHVDILNMKVFTSTKGGFTKRMQMDKWEKKDD
ncbi:MAG: 4Fe-4S binding protein [Arcobacteraceae bacterium]|nr:4Fe-4S binding protein [Arcobacteraceae bacterium]